MNVSPNRPDCTIYNALTHGLDHRMGLRQADDAGREVAKTPTRSREDAARTRPRESKTRESREEARPGYQEERKEWTNWPSTNTGKGSRPNPSIHPKVLPDADTTAGHILTDTDGAKQ